MGSIKPSLFNSGHWPQTSQYTWWFWKLQTMMCWTGISNIVGGVVQVDPSIYPRAVVWKHLSGRTVYCLTVVVSVQSHRLPGLLTFFSRWINCSYSQEIIWVCAWVWDPHAHRLVHTPEYPSAAIAKMIWHLPAFWPFLLGMERCGLGLRLGTVLITFILCKEYQKLVNYNATLYLHFKFIYFTP